MLSCEQGPNDVISNMALAMAGSMSTEERRPDEFMRRMEEQSPEEDRDTRVSKRRVLPHAHAKKRQHHMELIAKRRKSMEGLHLVRPEERAELVRRANRRLELRLEKIAARV
tara:strand:+ start:27 stop:362 length:336 start_codon:yes stop_codon:yes gene_type:complete